MFPEQETNVFDCNCYYVLKPIDQVLIALQSMRQVVGDTTGVDKSTASLAVADTILETSRENALWDTKCRISETI